MILNISQLPLKLTRILKPFFQDKTLSFVKSEEELKLVLKEVRYIDTLMLFLTYEHLKRFSNRFELFQKKVSVVIIPRKFSY